MLNSFRRPVQCVNVTTDWRRGTEETVHLDWICNRFTIAVRSAIKRINRRVSRIVVASLLWFSTSRRYKDLDNLCNIPRNFSIFLSHWVCHAGGIVTWMPIAEHNLMSDLSIYLAACSKASYATPPSTAAMSPPPYSWFSCSYLLRQAPSSTGSTFWDWCFNC